MKVAVAPPPKSTVDRKKRSAFRRLIGLVLMASFVSFAVAWVIKGETAKHGGVRLAIEKWAYTRGNKVLSSEQSFSNLLKAPYYMSMPTDVQQLVLDVNFKNFQKIQKKRQQALDKGLLVKGENDFVAAKIRHDGKTIKVKVRLKGDLLDHLEGDKWSFRVKVKGKNHLFGMRVFSVQNPLVRGFLGGPLFYATLKRYGVLVPRYRLVNLIVNGSDLGIMSVEEHFSKEMLESNGRKESVIIRFNESLVWDATDGPKRAGLSGHFDNYHIAKIDSFSTKKISRSERLSQDYEVAAGLLRAFETGAMAPSEVFDVKLMARYMAVSELWGSWHSFSWRNLRFYYNPVTSRLEPIGNDPDIQTRNLPGKSVKKGEPITVVMRSTLLDDPVIFAEFKNAVQLIAEDIKSGRLESELEQLQNKYLPDLRTEFFFLQPFDFSELEKKSALLESYTKADLDSLYQIEHTYPELVRAYSINQQDKSYIELSNITPSLVELLSVRWVNKKGKSKNIDVDFDDVAWPISLPPTPAMSSPSYRSLYLKGNAVREGYYLEVRARVKGSQEVAKIKVQPYVSALTARATPEPSLLRQAQKHKKYLRVDTETGVMTIIPGDWQVEELIVVPKNSVLKIAAATTLSFARQAGIVSYGSVLFAGQEKSEIVLQGEDDKSWQGVAVLNAAERSSFSHVMIKATKGMKRSGWQLTGGVTFYYSDVDINNSSFEDSRGEDALNIIHSRFELNDVLFRKTASDAFDADFSTGSVVDGLYQDIGLAGGGDAVDVSGSDITVNNTRFINIDDKAVSVGEQSRMQATGLDIDGAGTGAASKDDSVLELSSSKIHNVRVAGLMAYVKKPEYGPGHITASAIDFGEDFEIAMAQKGSTIRIDNDEVETIDIDVNDMYKTVMKKGLR